RSWRRALAPLLLLVALAALCVGLARPRQTTSVTTQQATVILVLDVSRSMESRDIHPTRLAAAEQGILGFLDRAPKNVRVGLILFAGEPFVASVPTLDRDAVRTSLQSAEEFPGFGGTAIGDALAAAVQLARTAVPGVTSTGSTIAYTPVASHGPVSILFLSDGHQTRGVLQPLQGAQRAKAAGIPVYTIALGTPNGTLDVGPLGGFPSGNGNR